MRIALVSALLAMAAAAFAASAGTPIYTCGRSASDYPSAICVDAKRIEAAKVKAAEEAAAVAAAETRRRAREDANLLSRFPDEAAHAKARQAELAPLLTSISVSESRMADLAAETKRLDDEKQFYPPPMPLPRKLKLDIDANDAALTARRLLIRNQQDEIVHVNALYDAQLLKLRPLWRPNIQGASRQ